MNRNRYRTIFSKRLGMRIAVAETTKAQGKSSGRSPGSGARIGRAVWSELAIACVLWSASAHSAPPLPSGGTITSGTGSINQSGNTLTVNQSSQNLSANWQSFDIAADHAVVFNQPNSSSIALNRVIGVDASSIYGSLTANGKVFLVNPNGVLFAPGAQVSVGGLVASTLSLSDEDFNAGRYRFTDGAGKSSVVNQGTINAGSVALIAPKIINNGSINTPHGNTTLAAGDRVTVSVLDGLLSAEVDVSVLNAEIQNHGQITADGGSVSMLAGRADAVLDSLINTDGVVRASSIRNENGKIYLDGGAGGTVNVSGTLDASAASAGQGGNVSVLGDHVTLASGANVDVSGQTRGGTALIGGDYRGKNSSVLNARFTAVETGATIRADGAEQGGRVIVWSNDTTQFGGDIFARGKGFVEVSGKGTLAFSGNVDTGGGTLLLDPTDITVQSAAGDQVNTFSGGQIATLLVSNDVILNADNNITWNSGVTLDYNGVGTRTLTLQAGNNISYTGTITDSVAGGDKLNVVFNADYDASGAGSIAINNSSSIVTSGGDITLRGGNAAFSALPAFTDPNYATALRATAARGISIGSATLSAGGGNITMRGVGVDGTSSGVGVAMAGSTIQTVGTGAITMDGIGGAGTDYNRGVQAGASTVLSTVDGALTLQGIGAGTGIENSGVRFDNSTIQATGSGNFVINSLGSTGSDYNDGMVAQGSTLRVSNGDMTITGTGRGTGLGSDGIELAVNTMAEATGRGNVTFNGTSAATGANTNRGVAVWLSSTVRTASGALTLQGTSADPTKGNAISLETSGTIGGTGQSGAITLTGDTINLASGAVLGTGTLLLQPLTPSATIGLGDSAGGTFNLTSSELGLIQNGFSSITVGRTDSSGAVDVRTIAFADPITIRTPAGSGSIAVNGTLSTGTGTSLGAITLQAAGAISLNNGIIDTSDILSLTGGSYTVTGTSTLKSNTLTFGNANGISNTGTLTFNQTADTTVANVISGTNGNLVKVGTNTLTLTGNNNYTGTTTINAGALQIGNGGTSGSLGTGAITNNGTLAFNRSSALSVASTIGGSGNLIQSGAGTLTLSGTSTYTGTTTINSNSTLQISGTGVLGSGTYASSITNNGTFEYSSGANQTLSGVIAGSGNILKDGAGTLTLAGSNTYSGTTTINAGLVAVTNPSGLGDTNGGTIVNAFGGLDLQNVAVGAENVTLAGGVGTYGYLSTTTGTSSLSGAITLAGPSTSVIVVGSGSQLTLSGVISGAGGLSKQGSNTGTLILTAANTYSGITDLGSSSGTLVITNDSALGSTSGGTTLHSGTTLELRNVTIAETINPNSGTILASTGVNTISAGLSNAFVTPVVNVLGGVQLTLAGALTGATPMIKNGSGTLTFTGNNTNIGALTINAGTVQVGNGGTTGKLGSGAVTVASGANLIFNRSDSVSLSTLASIAGGITGAGNVTALIGGDFNVDRPITLNGANSTILLEAGKNNAAGDAAGGDITLTSNISTSSTGTITLFSGHANTAAYEAKITGATGTTRYKTYNSSASSTSGAISGTRNYYYRQQPTSLTVSGLTASKVYDGLLDASSILDSSAAMVSGIDEDTVAYSALTFTGASFDSAHAGTRSINATYTGTTSPTYSSGGATWSVSGYATTNVTGAGTGAITPRSLTTSIDAVGKTYDGLTSTTSTFSTPSGFIGNDSATGVSGLTLAFDNPNAGTRNVVASGSGGLLGFVGTAHGSGSGIGVGNEVAGLASDYVIVTPNPVSAVIAQAPLTITANNDAKLITQTDTAGYNGVSYSGLVHGETAADLSGSLSITRSNAGVETVGTYTGVLLASGLSSSNYAINYVNGNYQILPAQQLLIKMQNVSNVYGTSASYDVVSAQYVDASGSTIHTLTQTAHNGNTYTYSDGIGGSVTFTVTPQGAVTSGAGYLAAGNYVLIGANASISGSNFVGLNYIGNQSVMQAAVAPTASGITKIYDGNAAMTGLTMDLSGLFAGDLVGVNASGTFSTRNAGTNLGYGINNIALSGADAGNYYLTSAALSGNNGVITPKSITVSGITADNRIYDGTTAATLTTTGYAFNGAIAGDTVILDPSSYSALFANRNVGVGKGVTVAGLGLSGGDAGNYLLAQPTGLTATITPRPITIVASGNTKYYDATTGAAALPILSGSLASGDGFTQFGERYASANVGTGLALIPFATIDDGNGGNNYAITFMNNAGVIQQHPLDISSSEGSSTASNLDDKLAAARRSDRVNNKDLHTEACASDAGEDCVLDKNSRALLHVISTGIKLPAGVSATDAGRDIEYVLP